MSVDSVMAANAVEPILAVKDLRVSFNSRGRVSHAVNGVGFDLRPGETLALVGESGSGKSVTALSLMRLLKTPPATVDGSVLLEGRDVLLMSDHELRGVRGGKIAMVFQDALSSLNPVRTIGAQVAEALALHLNLRGAAARRRAIEFLGRAGIPSPERRLGAYPHEFSGGMRQRVMIAIALSCGPKVVVADEPTTALDVSVQAQILALLRDMSSEFGTSLLMISHDLSIVAGLADRVAVMYGGELVEIGETERVFERPQHPYTFGLLECIPRIDEERVELLPTIEGTTPDISNLPKGCLFAPRCAFRFDRCVEERPRLEVKSPGEGVAACFADIASQEGRVGKAALAARYMTHGTRSPDASTTVAPRSTEPLLQVRDLSVEFLGSRGMRFWDKRPTVRAVRDVSLDVLPGETLGLVGESGSGKSTLARAILRVEDVAGGEVIFAGQNIVTARDSELRRLRTRLQMVFQDPYGSLNPRRSVIQTVSEPLQIHTSKSRSEIQAAASDLLAAVGLDKRFLARRPHELSGGQRQRVSVARALALDPDLVIADECTSALDVSVSAQILNLLLELQASRGLTYVFISHDLSTVRHMSNRIAVMYLGRIVELADRETLFRSPAHPYTQALLSVVPIPDPRLERTRYRQPIRGEIPSPATPPSGCAFHPRCPLAIDRCSTESPPLYALGARHHAACFMAHPNGTAHQRHLNDPTTEAPGG